MNENGPRKKLSTFIICAMSFIILNASSLAYAQEIRKEYFPDGAVQFERVYKDDQKHGLAKEFDEKGALLREVMYVNGMKQGPLKDFYADGTLKAVFTYKDDVVNGLVQKYFENGSLAHEHNYENGTPDGKGMKTFSYYDNGQRKHEYSYYLGDGYREEYFDNGVLKKSFQIKGARLVDLQEFDREGNLINEEKGGYNGILNSYDEAGKIIQINTYKNGRLIDFKPTDDSHPILAMLTSQLVESSSTKNSLTIYDYIKTDPEYPYIGFWKSDCKQDFGWAIDKAEGGLYSVTFCGPKGCFMPNEYRPNTNLENDSNYRIIERDIIEILGDGESVRVNRCVSD